MSLPKMSSRSASAISSGLFLMGLGTLFYLGQVWPGILLVIGLSLAFKQFLRGRTYDTVVTLFVFGGIFLFYFSMLDWNAIIPVLLVTGGLYLILREYFDYRKRVGLEAVEAEREEIEDEAGNA